MKTPRREKYPTRTVRLVGEQQREMAVRILGGVPLDSEYPLELVIREEVRARGLDQNGLYWLRLGEIAEMGWLAGRRYSKEVWHEYSGKNLMPEEITTKDGEVRSKWEETPDGTMTVISTTRLERKCFSEYITIVEAFGSDLGVMFSDNRKGREYGCDR